MNQVETELTEALADVIEDFGSVIIVNGVEIACVASSLTERETLGIGGFDPADSVRVVAPGASFTSRPQLGDQVTLVVGTTRRHATVTEVESTQNEAVFVLTLNLN